MKWRDNDRSCLDCVTAKDWGSVHRARDASPRLKPDATTFRPIDRIGKMSRDVAPVCLRQCFVRPTERIEFPWDL